MILDTNKRILEANDEKYKLFKKRGTLEAVSMPIQIVQSNSSWMLPRETLQQAVEDIAADQGQSRKLDAVINLLDYRLHNYGKFVIHAREAVEEFASLATRCFMMDFGKDKTESVFSWMNFKSDATTLYANLDEILIHPDKDLRHSAMLELRRLYAIVKDNLPKDLRSRRQLLMRDKVFEDLDLLLEQCEVYALLETI